MRVRCAQKLKRVSPGAGDHEAEVGPRRVDANSAIQPEVLQVRRSLRSCGCSGAGAQIPQRRWWQDALRVAAAALARAQRVRRRGSSAVRPAQPIVSLEPRPRQRRGCGWRVWRDSVAWRRHRAVVDPIEVKRVPEVPGGPPVRIKHQVQTLAVGKLCNCPGRKPAFLVFKRPARPYKSPMQHRFS
jgi:hypothetical protein